MRSFSLAAFLLVSGCLAYPQDYGNCPGCRMQQYQQQQGYGHEYGSGGYGGYAAPAPPAPPVYSSHVDTIYGSDPTNYGVQLGQQIAYRMHKLYPTLNQGNVYSAPSYPSYPSTAYSAPAPPTYSAYSSYPQPPEPRPLTTTFSSYPSPSYAPSYPSYSYPAPSPPAEMPNYGYGYQPSIGYGSTEYGSRSAGCPYCFGNQGYFKKVKKATKEEGKKEKRENKGEEQMTTTTTAAPSKNEKKSA